MWLTNFSAVSSCKFPICCRVSNHLTSSGIVLKSSCCVVWALFACSELAVDAVDAGSFEGDWTVTQDFQIPAQGSFRWAPKPAEGFGRELSPV